MAALPRDRYRHSCGLVVNPVLGPEIIVMGGFTSPARDNVDIYTVNTDSWREGNMSQNVSHFKIEMLENIPTTRRQSSATGNQLCFNNYLQGFLHPCGRLQP